MRSASMRRRCATPFVAGSRGGRHAPCIAGQIEGPARKGHAGRPFLAGVRDARVLEEGRSQEYAPVRQSYAFPIGERCSL